MFFDALPLSARVAIITLVSIREQLQRMIDAPRPTDPILAFMRDATALLLPRIDDYVKPLRKIPSYLFHLLSERLAQNDPDDAALREAQRLLEKAGAYDRGEAEHLLRLVSTTDALGVMLRGFVMVEGSLDSLIQNYLAHQIDLFEDLELFFARKVKLARALGLISGGEAAFLLAFNRIRNNTAHERRAGAEKPRYTLDVDKERKLWSLFIQTFGGEWPEYDAAAFPLHLKYICLYLDARFSAQVWYLRDEKLKDIFEKNEGSLFYARILPGVTLFRHKFARRLAEMDAESEAVLD